MIIYSQPSEPGQVCTYFDWTPFMLVSLSPTRTIFKLLLRFIMHPVKKKKLPAISCYNDLYQWG